MQKLPFNRGWRFLPGKALATNWWNPPPASSWRAVELPHDWSIALPRHPDNPSGVSNGFFEMGRGHYQKDLEVPAAWAGKKVFVEFEGVYMNAEVRLDEHFILRHPYGYTSFQVDLTPFLRPGQTQRLEVRVDNSAQLNSRWYSGSGIYRPAWLIVCEPVHIAPWGVYVSTPQISPAEARVQVQTSLQNEGGQELAVRLRSRVLAPDGREAGSAESGATLPAGGQIELNDEIQVPGPQLWSLESPSLYSLESEVYAGDTLLDRQSTSFGIRSLSFSAEEGFRLNGQALKIKGGCVHHDNGVLGAASYPRAEERKVALLKASGFNAIRTAHNPPAPAFLEACDRLGMLVLDEAFDCWRDGKNPHDYHAVFDDWWQRDIDNMLLRDRNHPSIILWSIGNEVQERDRPEGAGIAAMLAARVRALDPTRPVTSAICGTWANKEWSSTDGVFAQLDVGGYNYLWKNYAPDHERHPQRIMVGLESFPIEAFENWQAVLAHPYLIGDFVWTSLDYLGESGIGRVRFDEKEGFLGEYPWHQANCGDLDICGFKRPQSYYRDILWGKGTQLYFAVHTPAPEGKTASITQWGWPDVWPNWNWTGREGQVLTVEVYTACSEVELFLNGRTLGRQPAEKLSARFEVVYEPGELIAVGYTGGQPCVEGVLRSSAAPARLRLSAERLDLAAGGDLGYVTVEILDAAGQVHPTADRPVFFTCSGAGELIALGSGDPTSEEGYSGHQRSTYRGRCLAVVKAGEAAGLLHLRAQADGLEPAEVIFTVT